MSGAWAIQRATRKSGWIDTIWSGAVGLVSICVAAAATGGQRRFLVLALVLVWSSRLALHIARRTRGGGDDPRYAQMMRDWGDAGPRKLFAFLQWQALAGWTLVLAVALASNSPAPFPGIGDWFGCVLAIAGIAIEAVADAQLTSWRRIAAAGRVCDVGLWGHSRHPNYFGEWLFWLGVSTLAIDLSGAWAIGLVALLAPLQMYWLLTRASGIPPLEAHMLRTRGPAYEVYMRRTPAFFSANTRALENAGYLTATLTPRLSNALMSGLSLPLQSVGISTLRSSRSVSE